MATNSNEIKPDMYVLSQAQLAQLLRPKKYVCSSCGAEIIGEIPFKIHHTEKCPGKKKTKPAVPPVAPPDELKRMLRAKKQKS